MNIVINSEGLIIDTPNEFQSYSYYVRQNLKTITVTENFDCLNKIYTEGIFLTAPTPFHTAFKRTWVLTNENLKVLGQTVDMICQQALQSFVETKKDELWFQQISNVLTLNNKVLAYLRIKELQSSAPSYVDIAQYF